MWDRDQGKWRQKPADDATQAHATIKRLAAKGRKCEAHKVSQGRCQRAAAVERRTSGGEIVMLCRACDGRFGSVVGEKQ